MVKMKVSARIEKDTEDCLWLLTEYLDKPEENVAYTLLEKYLEPVLMAIEDYLEAQDGTIK